MDKRSRRNESESDDEKAGKRKVPTISVNADEAFDFNQNAAVRAFREQLEEVLQEEFDEIMKLMQERAGGGVAGEGAARYGKKRGSPYSSRNANGAGASSRRDGDHEKDDQGKESG